MLRINLTISEADLREIDIFCKNNRYSRSEFMVLSTLKRVRGGQPLETSLGGIPNLVQPKSEKGSYEETDYFCSHGRAWELCEHGCTQHATK